MKGTWLSQIEAWNERIRQGQGQQVARELRHIPRDEIPLEQLAKIANITWRINRPSIGLRLLYPRLREQSDLKMTMALDAFTEYAGCLLEVGALSEARQVLRDLGGRTPRSKFLSALLLFKEWNYEAAIPLLEEYLRDIPADYHQFVVRVNLASSYVNTRQWSKGLAFLAELKKELETKQHWLLLGNCYEIESQIYFAQGEHGSAIERLAQSEKHLDNSKNMGWVYCKKWQFINKIYLAKRSANFASRSFIVDYEEIRALANAMGSWESLRELDLHWSVLTGDEGLLNHVYYGSPSERYRRKIRDLAVSEAPELTIRSRFDWTPPGDNSPAPRLIDFKGLIGEFHGKGKAFLLKKLLMIFFSDFYAPFRIGQLFSTLFEGEFYDLETSPDRVFQLIKRLREWLEEADTGCEIKSGPRGYVVQIDRNRGVTLDRDLLENGLEKKTNLHFLFLHERFGGTFFTSGDVGASLSCSPRTANRVLKELRSEGRVESVGRGRFTRFRLVS